MIYLSEKLLFPPVYLADDQGVVAVGGDLSRARLKLAYKSGIFPWFNPGEPIVWWAPDPRMVLFLDELYVSKSMKKVLKSSEFEITFNTKFREVVQHCQQVDRRGQDGTWISNEMIDAYCVLHENQEAMSVEVWRDGVLVGGLYGVDLGHIFCGESMFSTVSNASKIAFIYLVEYLKSKQYKLLDCQVYNPHLESLGCREISRASFMKILEN